jgi:hypothetical protein
MIAWPEFFLCAFADQEFLSTQRVGHIPIRRVTFGSVGPSVTERARLGPGRRTPKGQSAREIV